MTIERIAKWTVLGGMMGGYVGLVIVVLAPSHFVPSIAEQAAMCEKMEGCKTLTIESQYIPEQKKLTWAAHVVTTRALDKEIVRQTLLASVQDGFLMSFFTQDVSVSIERQKEAPIRSNVRASNRRTS